MCNIIEAILYGIMGIGLLAIVAVMVMILGIFFSGWVLTMLSVGVVAFIGIILFNLM